jgi:ankyrin repeat protein
MFYFLTIINMMLGIVIVKITTGHALPTLEFELDSWSFWSWVILFIASAIVAGLEMMIINNIRYKKGLSKIQSPLNRAAIEGDLAAAQKAIKDGVDLNTVEVFTIKKNAEIRGHALTFAAVSGEIQVVRLLLEAGIDMNKEVEGGVSPLSAAITADHYDIAELLIEEGVELNRVDQVRGCTPLQNIALLPAKDENESGQEYEKKKHERVRLAQLMLQRGADPGQISDDVDKTALELAKESKFTALIKVLDQSDNETKVPE